MSEKVKFVERQALKEKPDTAGLGFGQYFTDYMLSYDYDIDKGWHDLKIVPYAPLEVSPAA
ncbi:MAG: branched chain amino acid aminotransferase, partial [Staphylococcus lugdunensis]|nr:branched chain amino acid aminotransferase [Staphylococcus lugdunensis]